MFLGEITIMNYRLTQIVQDLAEEYTCGAYHMLYNNCNHFSNDLAKKLGVNELPKFVFRSTNWLGYLCCCLPHGWMNGQEELKRLLEEEEQRERERAKREAKGVKGAEGEGDKKGEERERGLLQWQQ
jgi:hypothetical protein